MTKHESEMSRIRLPGDENYKEDFKNHIIEDEANTTIYSDRRNVEKISCTIGEKKFQVIPDEDFPQQMVKCDLVEMITKATTTYQVKPSPMVERFLDNNGNVLMVDSDGDVNAVFGKTPGVETSNTPRSNNPIVSQVYNVLGLENTKEYKINYVPDVTVAGSYSMRETKSR